MVIKVLGAGCSNCRKVEAIVSSVVKELGAEASVEHVADYKEIMAYGVLATPGLVIDGKLVAAGKVPSKAEVTTWVTTALAQVETNRP